MLQISTVETGAQNQCSFVLLTEGDKIKDTNTVSLWNVLKVVIII
jgi:hypothetical protein